ncbi:hypothetical protein VP01_664g13 [Puccinia sorghi]|uniref:Uncharacterized protein n=1 Tax=Puccinia sorghi TaxID=27349 RepID=A0A0L6UF38_9BASI|nr:hypothetical protein VP01_664g13 [Puccinia sorghi]
MVKEEHAEKAWLPGFTPFNKLFLAYSDQKGLSCRYQALMNQWRQVKDYVDRSRNGGLLTGLLDFGLSKLVSGCLFAKYWQ